MKPSFFAAEETILKQGAYGGGEEAERNGDRVWCPREAVGMSTPWCVVWWRIGDSGRNLFPVTVHLSGYSRHTIDRHEAHAVRWTK